MFRFSLTPLLLVACGLSATAADIDTVYRKSDGKSVGGEITAVSKTEVVVTQKVGNKEEHIPANDILFVEWKAEPIGLGLARSNERAGNFSEALEGFQQALGEAAGGSKDLKGSIEFLIAQTSAKVAFADATQTAVAIEKLNAFLSANRDHYRYYDAQLLLGQIALSAKDAAAAETAYSLVEQAPWLDYQLAGRNGQANAKLAGGDISGAKSIFDQVASASTTTPAETGRKLEGMLGQAECLKQQNNYAEALTILVQVIDQASAKDTRVLAQAYIKQGDCYLADGQQYKAAVVAYLHVDVIPSLAAHVDLHAEALYQLTKLWPAVDQPARAAEASAKLETEYPNSEWTKKLGS
ncbi:MAG: tetratricopeptide repeat protein [Planctomycetaceae bacterium]|nr:tetratricopeptide repeat protein [Planctomycetaceae bacterium]